jgi:hypothetical protein
LIKITLLANRLKKYEKKALNSIQGLVIKGSCLVK